MKVTTAFFKSIRKLHLLWIKTKDRYYIIQLKYIYTSRMDVKQDLSFGTGFKIIFDASGSILKVGKAVQFRDYCLIISGGNGTVTIGDNAFFNNFCSIGSLGNIEIGSNCQFGEGVKLYDCNHQYKLPHLLISQQGYSIGKISIGNNCWLGSNVIVLKDVQIGDNVVIGAGCIIYKSIPANSVVTNRQNLAHHSKIPKI